MTDRVERLMSQAASLGSWGAVARQQGEEVAADAHFRKAFGLALEAANQASDGGSHPTRLDALRVAARFALDCGAVSESFTELMARGLSSPRGNLSRLLALSNITSMALPYLFECF